MGVMRRRGKGEGWMRVADIRLYPMRSVQQGSERSQTQEKHCVEVKIHAALVLFHHTWTPVQSSVWENDWLLGWGTRFLCSIYLHKDIC